MRKRSKQERHQIGRWGEHVHPIADNLRNLCPKCKALPGYPCTGTKGQLRTSVHRARLSKAMRE